MTKKQIGDLGERIVMAYIHRRGFAILGKNIAYKTGELDVVARKGDTIHIIEVKTLLCTAFPASKSSAEVYTPAQNLHAYKIQKVARTAEWHLARLRWEGEWQIDGALVWIRESDGMARVQYFPQIL